MEADFLRLENYPHRFATDRADRHGVTCGLDGFQKVFEVMFGFCKIKSGVVVRVLILSKFYSRGIKSADFVHFGYTKVK